MKIQNEQLQALQQQTEAQKARQTGTPGAGGAFDALLSRELGESTPTGQAAPMPGVAGLMPPLDITKTESAASPEQTALEDLTGSIGSMLGSLDEYAAALSGAQGADLRKAHGILQGMNKDLDALRQNAPDLAERHPALASMVDEIAVIANAETVKMNRGDYF